MAQEIGTAWVTLLPSARGFSSGVQSEAEKGFQGAEKSSNGFFSGVAKWAKRGALLIGGMVATVGALAVKGGISRALNIEDATAKLKGLGNDTKTVEAIMNDALASVKGTAFGLDAAATTAASAVAAGIKPGQELERYLRLTADAATIAGTSMEEMGSIVNQVTSKGYAGMENLNRLTERGIPILQWLQDEYGVTADELAKMVSRGEVDATTFRKVIEDNIGGAALASGNTTRGAFANMSAALSRMGEVLVGGPFPQVKHLFHEITEVIDGFTTRIAASLGTAIPEFADDVSAFEGLSERILATFDSLSDRFSDLGPALGGLSGLTPVFTAIAGAMAPLLNSLPLIGRFLPAISGPVGAIAGLIAGLLIESEPLRESLSGLAETIGGALATAFGSAEGSLSSFGPMISEVLRVLGDGLGEAITAVTPAIGALIEAFGLVWEAISPLIAPLMEIVTAVLSLLGPLGELIGAVLPPLVELFMAVLGPVVELAGTILNALMPVIDGLVMVLTGLIGFVTGVFTGNWEQAWSGIQTLFQGVMNTIGAAFSAIGQLIAGVWNGILGILGGVIGWIGSTFQGAWNGLAGFFSGLWANISSGITGAWEGVMAFLGGIPDRIRGFFAGIGTWLLDSGKALIQGFINGISGMVDSVGDAVAGIMDFAGGFFPHSPAKRGPFSGAGWTAVAEGGEALIGQFEIGIEKRLPDVPFVGMSEVVGSFQGMAGFPEQMRLVVDGHEFTAFVDTRGDVATARNGAFVGRAVRNGRWPDA